MGSFKGAKALATRGAVFGTRSTKATGAAARAVGGTGAKARTLGEEIKFALGGLTDVEFLYSLPPVKVAAWAGAIGGAGILARKALDGGDEELSREQTKELVEEQLASLGYSKRATFPVLNRIKTGGGEITPESVAKEAAELERLSEFSYRTGEDE